MTKIKCNCKQVILRRLFITALTVILAYLSCFVYENRTKKSIFAAMAVINDLHNLILYHRKKSKLSRLSLSELAGVGKTVIYDLEKGKTTVRWATVLKVLKALNISIELKSPIMNDYEKSNS